MLGFKVLFFLSLFILGESRFLYNEIKQKKDDGVVCNLSQEVIDDIAGYSNVTNIIIDSFVNGQFKGKTWARLAELVDTFGNRLAGSQKLEDAIDYIVSFLKKRDLDNIHTEDVEIPFWERGLEVATLLEPRIKNLPLLALGYSEATSSGGITADAIVVKSFDELNALPDEKVKGKIVIYAEPYTNYEETVIYRNKGASEASKKGAVAALVRSITPFSIASLHTGMQTYADNVTHIPAAAITFEDADEFLRFQNSGKNIKMYIAISATVEIKTSRNTIADLTGSTLPNKIVVVSGHLDSWDVGTGAMDNGGGCLISLIAPLALKTLNLRPQRTLRTILWTADELGLLGVKAYEKAHKDESDNLNFVLQSDFGAFSPLGLIYSGGKTGECMVREILKHFQTIGATEILVGETRPGINLFTNEGVPGGELMSDNEKYFWFHHSEGDTMSVYASDDLDKAAAFWTAFSYIVADLKHDIPREK